MSEISRLRRENERLRREAREDSNQRSAEEHCKLHGHRFYRIPYVGAGGSNRLVCERCGYEKED